METEATAGSVLEAFREVWERILDYLPSLAGGLLILLLGLVICWLIKKTLVRLLLLMRLDRALRNVRWTRGLTHADVRHTLANGLGTLAATIVFLIFLNNAVVVWKLQVVGDMIGQVVTYLPSLLVGLLILFFGGIIAGMLGSRVRSGLASEGVVRAGLAGRLTHWALMLFVFALTLEVLDIAPHTVQRAFVVVLATLGLVVVLAFGLGSREAVARMWQVLLDKPPREE